MKTKLCKEIFCFSLMKTGFKERLSHTWDDQKRFCWKPGLKTRFTERLNHLCDGSIGSSQVRVLFISAEDPADPKNVWAIDDQKRSVENPIRWTFEPFVWWINRFKWRCLMKQGGKSVQKTGLSLFGLQRLKSQSSGHGKTWSVAPAGESDVSQQIQHHEYY